MALGVAPVRRPQRLAGLRNGPPGSGPRQFSRPSQRESAPCCANPEFEIIDGAKICSNCGTQVSENNIVAEVTFGESGSGAAVVEGGHVGENQRFANSLGAVAQRRAGGSGRERGGDHEMNGREALRTFTGRIAISQTYVDQALHLYKLAARESFTQGRRAEEVAGACLYAACRRDKQNTVLLMDLAEIIKVNVFHLGDTYRALTKLLYLEVKTASHLIEIEPLVLKYAAKLEFGDQTRQVAEDAVKIIRRMKRDWITTGRHPAGLCGACIILAARMNNFRRSVREVVFVVKVADLTIAKRLEEFKRTRSSALTVDEFRSVGNRIKVQHDPPALFEAKERARKLLERKRKREEWEASKNNPIEVPDDESVVPSRQSSVAPSESSEPADQQQEDNVASSAVKRRKKTTATAPAPRQPRTDADGFAIPELPIDPLLLAAANAAAEEIAAADETQPGANGETPIAKKEKKPRGKTSRPKKEKRDPLPEPAQLTEEELVAEAELQNEIEDFLRNDDCVSKSKDEIEREKLDARASALAEQQRALMAETLAQRAAAHGRSHYVIPDSEIIGEDEFADDPEVQNALLTEEQVKVKERIWVAHNEDWLRLQQLKQLKRAMDEAEGKNKEKVKRKKRGRMGDGTVLEGGTPVESPADANRRMIEKRAPKQFSQRVNYAALGAIYNTRGTPAPSETSSLAGTPAPESRAGSVEPSDTDPAAGAELPTPAATQEKTAEEVEQANEENEEEDDEDYWPDADAAGQNAEEPEENEEAVANDLGVALNPDEPEWGSDGYEEEYLSDAAGDDQGFESP